MKDFLFSDLEHFRYERKFHIRTQPAEYVEAILKLHPALFTEIYHERTINNIYFDTFSLQHYFDTVNGVNRRLKVRVRWYGNLFGLIKEPVLELKLKHNMRVAKLLYPLKPFTLDNNFSIDIMRDIFEKSPVSKFIKLHLMELQFTLLNSYNRKYFLSASHEYRVTVDAHMLVYKLFSRQNSFLYKNEDTDTIILELKYNKLQDEFADYITKHFPFRITRISKYADGIMKL